MLLEHPLQFFLKYSSIECFCVFLASLASVYKQRICISLFFWFVFCMMLQNLSNNYIVLYWHSVFFVFKLDANHNIPSGYLAMH